MLCLHIRQSLGMGKEGQGRRRIIAYRRAGGGGAHTLHSWSVRPRPNKLRGMERKLTCLQNSLRDDESPLLDAFPCNVHHFSPKLENWEEFNTALEMNH